MQNDTAITAALNVMQAHIDALNARDEHALAATLHFPHFRLSGPHLKTWETSESYFKDFRTRAGTDWNRSEFRDIQVLSASPDKVHLDVDVRRFDTKNAELTQFRSLWVITCENTIWAAKFRSSFAAR